VATPLVYGQDYTSNVGGAFMPAMGGNYAVSAGTQPFSGGGGGYTSGGAAPPAIVPRDLQKHLKREYGSRIPKVGETLESYKKRASPGWSSAGYMKGSVWTGSTFGPPPAPSQPAASTPAGPAPTPVAQPSTPTATLPVSPALTGLQAAGGGGGFSNVTGGSGAFAPGEGGEAYGPGVALPGPGAIRQGIGTRMLPSLERVLQGLRQY